ncbi:hypothetical protein HYPSUDRAFT_80576 [Hypholoma sublateritium FD-334 SS-4]|uniref:Methyltransferase type 11 domain-containing protein n=1 Tax=Hypholoma sublateritium (strain FD-334 SS-4) TaxID=945553 RepID=A0A0D2KKV1_HYPSF|nr:hypothetical protein HYPSUDRAFT_80576 [Hypholoma sublateritium FD-334 SS-4]
MRLSNILGPLHGLWLGLTLALVPTLRAVLRAPRRFLLHPERIARVYMAHVWAGFGDGVDEGGRGEKERLIRPHAVGRVLDIGAGHGHTARYLDRARVTQYIALEPNTLMHARIRAEAAAAGFAEADGSLVVLACGAEDTGAILAKLSLTPTPSSPTHSPSHPSHTPPQIDTLISVLTLCTVPRPARTLASLVRSVLKPGGRFLMAEHVLSARADVARWQRVWAPLWSVGFDGCRMDRATDVMVAGLRVGASGGLEGEGGMEGEEGTEGWGSLEGSGGMEGKECGKGGGEGESAWSEVRTWRQEGLDTDEGGENMFGHSYGVFVKR